MIKVRINRVVFVITILTILLSTGSTYADTISTSPAGFLKKGWNLLSLQYLTKDTAPDNITFTGNGVTKIWADAVAAGWIESTAQGFDPATQSYFTVGLSTNPAANKTVLQSWYGYWMLVKTNVGLSVTIPAPNNKLIPDAKLEEAIRYRLNKPTGDLTVADLQSIYGKLDASTYNIYNLEGLQYCTNVDNLDLAYTYVNDLRPLADLTNLLWLDLTDCKITNITPLAVLTKLTYLNLKGNSITVINALQNMADLTELRLDFTSITDLSALVNNTGLSDGDIVDIRYDDNLDLSSGSKVSQQIQTLVGRGVNLLK